ncbi:hypothetical protein LIER_27394 [Lithospermum erythrorhizon]|uniref:Histone-binding protein RBBP4-like N-terminal domain-containing protein n=1 Tax=Lithospermum erythrorhizon TaxID=34254 RepID=A0AAV3RBW0_LITER
MTQNEADFRLINEDYKIWKRNVPFLYDLSISHALEWPSLTVDWLPDREELSDKNYSVQRMVLGTHISDDTDDDDDQEHHLIIAQIKLPIENDQNDDRADDIAENTGKVQITQQIVHDGEVNRARHMPQNPFIIATKSSTSDVNVFDYSKHPSKPPLSGICYPELILKGHTAEGYGVSWSLLKNGHLLSGSDDGNICLWDINATPQNKDLDALQIYTIDEGVVDDVAWHPRHEYLFGSVGDDKFLHMWDIRDPSVTKPIQSVVAHEGEVQCLDFNPFNEWIVATGSSDKTVKLFDLRKFTNAVHTLQFHKDDVFKVGWSPKNETILASSCHGRQLLVWDVSRIGGTLPPEEAEEGPPELLFIHGGHTSKISDFSWNPCEDWVMASVASDNILQIWQMADHIYQDEGDLPEDNSSKAGLSESKETVSS